MPGLLEQDLEPGTSELLAELADVTTRFSLAACAQKANGPVCIEHSHTLVARGLKSKDLIYAKSATSLKLSNNSYKELWTESWKAELVCTKRTQAAG